MPYLILRRVDYGLTSHTCTVPPQLSPHRSCLIHLNTHGANVEPFRFDKKQWTTLIQTAFTQFVTGNEQSIKAA